MKKGAVLTIIIVAIVIILLAWWIYQANKESQPAASSGSYSSSTMAASGTPVLGSPNGASFDQSISDGTITLQYPSADFGLATNPQQILVSAVIPPCDQNFNYCLYYDNSSTYAGTNFESAGIRIQKRTALATQSSCLTTQPAGYTNLTPTITTSTDYAVSVFPQLDDGAAGSTSSGSLYRLFYKGACYEFETRIGQSEFANYPSGSIQEFTSVDASALQFEIQEILATLTLPGGETVVFPGNSAAAQVPAY
jgi:hypothetical protein